MIEIGLSDEYLKGFGDRLKSIQFDNEKSDEWQMGWRNADQNVKIEELSINKGNKDERVYC